METPSVVWLRSQDGLMLVAVTLITAEAGTASSGLWSYGNDGQWCLGRFSTPDVAQAELDAIERFVASGAQGVYAISKAVKETV